MSRMGQVMCTHYSYREFLCIFQAVLFVSQCNVTLLHKCTIKSKSIWSMIRARGGYAFICILQAVLLHNVTLLHKCTCIWSVRRGYAFQYTMLQCTIKWGGIRISLYLESYIVTQYVTIIRISLCLPSLRLTQWVSMTSTSATQLIFLIPRNIQTYWMQIFWNKVSFNRINIEQGGPPVSCLSALQQGVFYVSSYLL